MLRSGILILALTNLASSVSAQSGTANSSALTAHDNVRPAGKLENGILTVSLRVATGRWFPEGQASAPFDIEAFGEEGQPLSVPSPLIRATVGTKVNVSVRNTLGSAIRVFGLCEKPGRCEPMVVAPGATSKAEFTLNSRGTFAYWATTQNKAINVRDGADSQLGGAIIADDGTVDPRERVFVLGLIRRVPGAFGTEITSINGRSWPLSERQNHVVGDTVKWRVVNLTTTAHAMHLHGFYFNVESAGDGSTDTPRASKSVTERVGIGGTFTMSWVPERAGNWLFHCHMLEHMSRTGAEAQHAAGHAPDSASAGMAGLVLGVHVTGPETSAVADSARRKIQMMIQADTRLADAPSYKVDVSSSGTPAPRINERPAPGPIIVVTRGEPVAIEIQNHLNEPTAIHWHGIELESYNDGVPGFGGTTGSLTPPVPAHGTFTARFTPPRAGTFMYHTHWHKEDQLSGGIYGPLLVLEPGQRYDPESDHILILGLEGKYRQLPNEPFSVNGEKKPRALELKACIPHRLRFINITGDGVGLTVQLLSIHDPVQWTVLAKDGADIPASQRTTRQARQLVAVGEIYDVGLAPMQIRADGLWMELRRSTGELLFQWPVRVK